MRPGKFRMKLFARALERAELVGEKKAAWAKVTREAGVIALVVVTLWALWIVGRGVASAMEDQGILMVNAAGCFGKCGRAAGVA